VLPLFLALGLTLGQVSVQGPSAVSDLDGKVWTPLAPARGEVHLLVFVTADCPVSNRYAPEVARIASEYAPKGVRTFLVFTDPALGVARIRSHVKEFYGDLPAVTIQDRGFPLVKATGATVTPEAAVYTSTGRQYRGRIDDLYIQLGRTRTEATQRDLRNALDAVLAGRPVVESETQAVGCYIERTL
jgi:hypothetical protein